MQVCNIYLYPSDYEGDINLQGMDVVHRAKRLIYKGIKYTPTKSFDDGCIIKDRETINSNFKEKKLVAYYENNASLKYDIKAEYYSIIINSEVKVGSSIASDISKQRIEQLYIYDRISNGNPVIEIISSSIADRPGPEIKIFYIYIYTSSNEEYATNVKKFLDNDNIKIYTAEIYVDDIKIRDSIRAYKETVDKLGSYLCKEHKKFYLYQEGET